MRLIPLALSLIFATACDPVGPDAGPAEPDASEELDASVGPEDNLSGTYNVDTVTCNGADEVLSVVATVTFDGTSYLEEWTFANSTCELSLAGTAVVSDDELTLEDVEIVCTGDCPPNICDDECSVDQVYAVSNDDDGLLLSFTQQGDEFGCGPCGDGVPSTYLLVEETP